MTEVLISLCLRATDSPEMDQALILTLSEEPLGWRSMPGGLGVMGPLPHLLKENMFMAT